MKDEILAFIKEFDSLILATSANMTPDCSYVPYVLDEELNFYIFVSHLAKHTDNLLSNNRFSILFIEDEKEAKNIFARKRVSFEGKSVCLDEDVVCKQNAQKLFIEKFGDFFVQLSAMPDFSYFKLSPSEGIFIKGFGKAFHFLVPSFETMHINGGEKNPHKNRFTH